MCPKINFNSDEFLSEKNIKEGHVYIAKDGRILLYLGKDSLSRFIFYIFGCAMFCNYNNSYSILTISNYEIQVKYLIELCNACMSNNLYKESILVLKGLPRLYVEFSYVDYSKVFKNWYTKNKLLLGDLPVLDFSNKNNDTCFVKSKDLVPGNLYYSGSCWRATYVFLGRTKNNLYAWYFVGNTDKVLNATAKELMGNIHFTKSNKKVRNLKDAIYDKDAHISKDTKMLIDMGYRVDLNKIGITKELLNYMSEYYYNG